MSESSKLSDLTAQEARRDSAESGGVAVNPVRFPNGVVADATTQAPEICPIPEPTQSSPVLPATKEGTVKASVRRLLWKNLITLIVLATFTSFWIWRFTDGIENWGIVVVVTGVLAALDRFVPEEFAKAARESLRAFFFTKTWFWQLCIALLSLEAIVASFVGSVEVPAFSEKSSRAQIFKDCPRPVVWTELEKGKPLRKLVWTTWWNPTRRYVIIDGSARTSLTVKPWHVEIAKPEEGFPQVVALLIPSNYDADRWRKNPGTVAVRDKRGLDTEPTPYHGESIWLGVDSAVPVPANMDTGGNTPHDILSPFPCPPTLNAGDRYTLIFKRPNLQEEFKAVIQGETRQWLRLTFQTNVSP